MPAEIKRTLIIKDSAGDELLVAENRNEDALDFKFERTVYVDREAAPALVGFINAWLAEGA